MKTIPLTQGKVAMVDDADFEAVNAHKWYAHNIGRRWCARRNVRKTDGKQTGQFLHQFLMPGVAEIDHRDGDALNNQRVNIRPATRRQNQQGFRWKEIGTTSNFRGVSWDKFHRKWKAQIQLGSRRTHLGYFEVEKDAAHAYDAAARKYFVDGFIHLNFP